MKRFFVLIVVIGFLCQTVSAQETANLETALKKTTEYFAGRLPMGSRVVVLNITSRHPELSDYIINEMTMHFFNNGNFMMVDRQNLEAIRQEMNFQYSGDVSDESMVSIGKKLGAQTIISGNIAQAGDTFRLQVRAIAVETAAIQGMQSSNIVIDRMMATLTGAPLTQAMIDEDDRRQRVAKMQLDGKNVFAFSLNGAYIPPYGFSVGTNITVFEKHYKKIAPSAFITFNWVRLLGIRDDQKKNFEVKEEISGDPGNWIGMDIDEFKRNPLTMNLFTLGGGVLFKYRVTDRFILNAGPSLEYIFGSVYSPTENMNYTSHEDQAANEHYGSLGIGIQGGFQFRVSPNVSLDVNGIVKFGFSSGENKLTEKGTDYAGKDYSYTITKTYKPFAGGIGVGMTFMFPYR